MPSVEKLAHHKNRLEMTSKRFYRLLFVSILTGAGLGDDTFGRHSDVKNSGQQALDATDRHQVKSRAKKSGEYREDQKGFYEVKRSWCSSTDALLSG